MVCIHLAKIHQNIIAQEGLTEKPIPLVLPPAAAQVGNATCTAFRPVSPWLSPENPQQGFLCSFLDLCFPESVDVAICINGYGLFLSCREDGFGGFIRHKIFQLDSVFRFQTNE